MMEGMMQNMEGQQPFSPEMMAQQGNEGLFLFLGGLAFTLVLYATFGAIGGAIGAAIFGGDSSSQSGGVQEAEAEIVE